MRALQGAITFLVATAAGAGQAQSVPVDLAAAVSAYDQAQVKGNKAELERLLADDYTLVNSSGGIEDKAALIRDYTTPGFVLEPFTVEAPIEKVWPDGAVMGGVTTLRGMDGGKPYQARLRFADIWAKRAGSWRVIYTQVSKAP